MKQMPTRLILTGAILVLVVSVAGAQTAATPPAAPGGQGLRVQAPGPPTSASPTQEKIMGGPVKEIDTVGKTIAVGWLFGLFSTTLEVTEETRIAIEGAAGSLRDIRDGDVVQAAYEVRDGKNIARAIEVTEAEPQRPAGLPPLQAPVPSSVPLMGVPPGHEAPIAGAPKAS
jgi:hypothetical protein